MAALSGGPLDAGMSGIDLLMNPKKRAGSEASSAASSVSGGGFGGGMRQHPPDATVRLADVHMPQQQPPFFFGAKPQNGGDVGRLQDVASIRSGSSSGGSEEDADSDGSGSESGSDDGSSSLGTEDEEGSGSALARPRYTPEQVANMKRDIMYQFDRIEAKGVRLPRRFTMADSLEEMKAELDRLKTDREVDISVRFQRKMLMTCVTGIEMLNGKFDPFDVRLDGWSDSMNESMGDYDELFEELHMKYRGKAKMAPELKLMFMVGGSAVMFHMTSSMFRPQDAGDRNRSRGGGGGGGGGGLFGGGGGPAAAGGGMFGGLLGSIFGGGGRGGAAPPPPPVAGSAMRGPKHVDDILKDLHRGAFPGGSAHHAGDKPAFDSSRVEIISNASESDISELNDDPLNERGLGGRRRGRK